VCVYASGFARVRSSVPRRKLNVGTNFGTNARFLPAFAPKDLFRTFENF
jgi:hypothetical protein